jgi:hypothetical protein
MTGQIAARSQAPVGEGKYARVERGRRSQRRRAGDVNVERSTGRTTLTPASAGALSRASRAPS